MCTARLWVISVLSLALGISVHAAAQSNGAETLLYQNRRAALSLGADVIGLIQATSKPGESQLSLYVGIERSDTRLIEASVSMDGHAPMAHHFNNFEGEALDASGLFYLGDVHGTVGGHSVHASLTIAKAGAESEAATIEMDQDIEIPEGQSDAVLTASAGGWLSSRSVSLKQDSCDQVQQVKPDVSFWSRITAHAPKGERCELGAPDDPKVRLAHYFVRDKDYLKAAATLVWLHRLDAGKAFSYSYYFELAKTLVGYGLLPESFQAYRLAVQGGLDRDEELKLRYAIVQAYLDQGDAANAEAVLGKAPDPLKKLALIQWQDYKSRLLIARKSYLDAEALLRGTENLADYESYVRYYNLGFSLFTDGSVGQGITVLDRIGSRPNNDPHIQNLSDKANLVLGLHFLRQGQGATAIPMFERIHSRGPYANSALLNLGWAWLAPPGNVQSRVMLGDERVVGPPQETLGALRHSASDTNLYQRYHLEPFARAKLESSEDANYKRALATWSELLERDPTDEAVQEAYMAIALALDHLGAHRDAISYFERAVDALQASAESRVQAAAYIRDGWTPGTHTSEGADHTQFERGLAATPPADISQHLIRTLASAEYQSGVSALDDLTALSNNLMDWKRQLDGMGLPVETGLEGRLASEPPNRDATDQGNVSSREVALLGSRLEQLEAAIATTRVRETVDLREQLAGDLDQQRRWKTRMLTDVRFELARMYDGASLSDSVARNSTN